MHCYWLTIVYLMYELCICQFPIKKSHYYLERELALHTAMLAACVNVHGLCGGGN